ncbi:hypothetical protein LGH82_29890 [Mesorhizobium sp. PAMC28654]|uniref:hypothetical protein n=1 Tax=Mesorhizobium sp. PAMC28654 TaxID=2880934 RepID=UPI001D09BF11|nr:hypothetical protein [Mesorhizobium sp. PAMC28654]UDL89234.1 hypothetical protein LGH82_29890 [Mesorhizobium sp. PAMC28654]
MSLFTRLRASSVSASVIPYKFVLLESGIPKADRPDENVKAFVAERAGFKAVKGWLILHGAILDKHVVIEQVRTGARFDVTPLMVSAPFFEHPGPVEEFEGLCGQISLPYWPGPTAIVRAPAEIDPTAAAPVESEKEPGE